MAVVFVVAGIVFGRSGGIEPGLPAVAMFPPWWDRLDGIRAVADADGSLLRPGGWPGLLVVQAADAGFTGRLHRAGAWLVFGSHAALGCGTPARRAP